MAPEPRSRGQSRKMARPSIDPDSLQGFSTSVQTAVQRFDASVPVSAWAVVREICELHPEYGGKIAERLIDSSGPSKAAVKRMTEWLDQVKRTIFPNPDGVIHGRLVILGLARVDPDLGEFLMPSGLVPSIEAELGRSDALYRDEPPTAALSDPTPLHIDNPASADQLGRDAFARALAWRLDRIWNEHHAAKGDSSFVLHLHGPWGSGKTSLLNLLRRHLQPENAAKQASRWIVVEFNAWQHQRIDPPWWPLLDTIYRQARQQIAKLYGKQARWWKLTLREIWWRFTTGNREHLVLATSVVILTFTLIVITLRYWSKIGTQIEVVGKIVTGVIAILGVVGGIAAFATRSFLSGSAGAAEKFVRSAVDPMTRVTCHFQDLVTWINQPLIVFIDDLDRCRSDYVVGLLEGVQTLFKDRRVMYVIAADRRWLYACYGKVYENFADSLQEPGRDLGCLFLEKAVQLSVSLPRLSESLQATFWDYLINGRSNEAEQRLDSARADARKEFEGAITADEIAAKLQSVNDPIKEHALREEAVIKLASERAEASTEYFLRDFAPLLEPNPRAMKRLLNAYALHRDMAILSGLDVLGNIDRRKQLVLWTIVCLRWPLLEQLLMENMDYVEPIVNPESDVVVPEAMQPLLGRPSVRRTFQGDGIGIGLDKKTIQDFAELRASNSSSAVVG